MVLHRRYDWADIRDQSGLLLRSFGLFRYLQLGILFLGCMVTLESVQVTAYPAHPQHSIQGETTVHVVCRRQCVV